MPTDKSEKSKTKTDIESKSDSSDEAEVITVKSSNKTVVDAPKTEDKKSSVEETKEEQIKNTASFRMLDADKEATEKTEEKIEVKSETEKPIVDEKKEEIKNDDMSSWIGDTPQKVEEVQEEKKSKLKPVLLILLIVLILGIIGGGVYYYMTKMTKSKNTTTSEPQVVVQPTEEPTVEPSPSSSPAAQTKIDYKKYKVDILNGSGIPGEAGKVKSLISKTGFTDIKTWNADNYDYTDTIVSMKKDIPQQVFDSISKDLEGNYSVKQDENTLSSSSSYDIVITVGTKK